eukprot:11172242-Lingulodinium_polyedra.AAC.1
MAEELLQDRHVADVEAIKAAGPLQEPQGQLVDLQAPVAALELVERAEEAVPVGGSSTASVEEPTAPLAGARPQDRPAVQLGHCEAVAHLPP